MAEGSHTRRRDIDWLRIFAAYLLLPFHVAKVFDVRPFYHLKNETLLPALDYATWFIHIWHMPLFFLLAGWSAQRSLAARGGGAFAVERLQRILLPLLVGIVLLCPGIAHVEYNMIRGEALALEQSLALFFTDFAHFTWSHLWFLAYLLTFTLLTVPWMARLPAGHDPASGEPPRRVHPLLVWAPLGTLVAAQLLLRPRWPGYQNLYDDWANVTYYGTFFVTGFLLSRYPAFERAAHRQTPLAVVIAVLATVIHVTGALNGGAPEVTRVAFAFASLGWVLTMLGLAHAGLRHRERGRPYLAESAYPVYWLHQWFIVIPGYFLTRALDWPVLPEALLLLAVAAAGTVATYHWLVRPYPVPRLMLGLRPR